MRETVIIPAKLLLRRLVSRVVCLVALMIAAPTVFAHEVLPTVGQISAQDGELRLELRLNAEALLAGIDLDGLEDTNNSDASDAYDELRMLDPEALGSMLQSQWGEVSTQLNVLSGDDGVDLTVSEVEVSEVGNTDLARPTRVILTGALPEGAQSYRLAWPDGFGTLALRQTGVEEGFTGYIDGGSETEAIDIGGGQAQTGWQAFVSYIPIGFDHILPKGLDHILFVLGLFFLTPRIGPLLWQVSAFTLAHTVTLALGATGAVTVSPAIVEPLIAASIAFVAIENIFSTRLHRWRPAVIFGFGLLHGLGFASVLQDFGIPEAQFFPALIGFNVGVELGQLTVIALAFLAVGAWFGQKTWYRAAISIPASVLIACVGLYWAFERTFL